MLEAIRKLCLHHVHRMPVVDVESGNLLCMLTHKRLLNYLYHFVSARYTRTYWAVLSQSPTYPHSYFAVPAHPHSQSSKDTPLDWTHPCYAWEVTPSLLDTLVIFATYLHRRDTLSWFVLIPLPLPQLFCCNSIPSLSPLLTTVFAYKMPDAMKVFTLYCMVRYHCLLVILSYRYLHLVDFWM